MPKGRDIITVNNTNITPLITELVEYVKTQKAIEGVELQDLLKMPKANHPDWKIICGILCNAIVEWAAENKEKGGKDLLVHLQNDVGYILQKLGLTE